MNKIILLVLFASLFSAPTYAQSSELVGTWESKDIGDPVQMILDDKGFITFKANGQLMGGVGYNINGQMLRMTYKTQQDRSHYKITIIIRDMIKKQNIKRDTGTVVFQDSSNIEVCFNKTLEDGSRGMQLQDCRSFLKIL